MDSVYSFVRRFGCRTGLRRLSHSSRIDESAGRTAAHAWLVVSVALASGCSATSAPSHDGATTDAALTDAAHIDATVTDASPADASPTDASPADAAPADASPADDVAAAPPATEVALAVGGVLLDHDYNAGSSYDYNPSIIQSGNLLRFWWCGGGANPTHGGYTADNIYYAEWDASAAHFVTAPTSVFNEGAPGTWDDYLDCNPSVVAGNFAPFGDGAHYTLALYYVAIPTTTSVNRIGVAFSNDGQSWRRWPTPIITAPYADSAHCSNLYGIGSPSTYSIDGKGSVRLFFEDFCNFELFSATSTDGVHFAAREAVSKAGLSYCNSTHAGGIPTDANLAFDPANHAWYATMDLGCDNFQRSGERGTVGFKLFRMQAGAIDSLANGQWQELATIDTNLTGYEINSWPAPTRDQFGNVDLSAGHDTIQMFYSVSNPRAPTTSTASQYVASTDPTHWDIAWALWSNVSGAATSFERFQGSTHEITTGYADRSRFPVDEGSVGLLYQAPQGTLTTPLYNCQSNTNSDFFVSTDLLCEGQRIVGLQGYALTDQHGGDLPLYRCVTSAGDRFVSHDPGCEGATMESLLGYALPK